MGAYLKYKLANPERAVEASDFVEGLKEQQILKENTDGYLPVWFWDEEDIEAEEKRENGVPDIFIKGEGSIKTSGMTFDRDKYIHLVVDIFEKLHEKFEVKVWSGSCSLSEHYFTPEQIKIITDNGEALTGDSKEEIMDIIEKV